MAYGYINFSFFIYDIYSSKLNKGDYAYGKTKIF